MVSEHGSNTMPECSPTSFRRIVKREYTNLYFVLCKEQKILFFFLNLTGRDGEARRICSGGVSKH